MKKVFLICPADPSQMPYIQTYIKLLNNFSLEYELIVWDRKGALADNGTCHYYRDSNTSLKRGFIDYFKFAKFFNSILSSNKSGGIVVAFGIPVLFFMKASFFNKFKVISDIRDHHMLLNFFPSLKVVLRKTALNVLSSAGFKKWLPKGVNYIVNHNTGFSSESMIEADEFSNAFSGSISCIGALKDYDVLEELILTAERRREDRFIFKFHGEGVINDKLERLKDNIKNVPIKITGSYLKEIESALYADSDWINMFMSNTLNNNTCLSNRLYNSVYYGKPLLCYRGSYLSEIIERYSLGLVFRDVDDFFMNFDSKFSKFHFNDYNIGRRGFFKVVDEDNEVFCNLLSAILVANK